MKNNKTALIVDFFAGSGTTLHAVNLLNAEDDGQRRCIMVTNNEVSEDEAKSLKNKGYNPGDDAWEALGIARYVTWPRTVCSIEGHNINGKPLEGTYITTEESMADGFKANAAYFKLGFLDKTSIALGRQLAELLPVLWLKAGAYGVCPRLQDEKLSMMILPDNRFAILMNEKHIFISTKEENYVRKPAPQWQLRFSRMFYAGNKEVTENLKKRHIRYEEQWAKVKQLEQEGKALILRPHKDLGVTRYTTDRKLLEPWFQLGYDETMERIDEIRRFIGEEK